jgi:hypothetical protein
MFARSHDRLVRSSSQGHISIGSMLSQGDDGTFKGPGIFFYTKGMPVMLLENLLTPFKLVNGRIGKAVDVVVDSDFDVFDLNDRYVLCSRPPTCVIVEYDEPTGLTFPGLAPNQHPFFPRKYSSTIKDLITRQQEGSTHPGALDSSFRHNRLQGTRRYPGDEPGIQQVEKRFGPKVRLSTSAR